MGLGPGQSPSRGCCCSAAGLQQLLHGFCRSRGRIYPFRQFPTTDQLMGKGGNVTSAGWQVTLCDPMWHVSSRSGVATLRTAIHMLLTCYLIVYSVLSTLIKKIFVYIAEKGTSVWNSVPNSRLRQFCSGTSIAAAWVQLNSTKVDVQCDKLAASLG